MPTELRAILRAHASKYPKMMPCDCVKLIYQNEFGGGHLITDREACLLRLRREYDATAQQPDIPLLEDIGNGMVRVMLPALSRSDISPESLCDAFIRSAAAHQGNPDSFLAKLQVLSELTAQGCFSFCPEELDAYLSEYLSGGYPAVSHSEIYRQSYHPAYRVLCAGLLPTIHSL
jgi:hypothetical protein